MNSSAMAAVLDMPYLSRIRRNHGLEHASLHLLSQHYPGQAFSGHSDAGGFWIVGDVSREGVNVVVQEALMRMKAGEKTLAVHPNCGTNFVTSGLLAGLAGFVAFTGGGHRLRDRLERLPLAATLSILALILARPLGLLLQREVTTSGNPGKLQIVTITSSRRGRWMMHRIRTQG
jgi:Domain of unknown function (DUF6391)